MVYINRGKRAATPPIETVLEKKYSCFMCGREYKTEVGMKRHEKNCKGEK